MKYPGRLLAKDEEIVFDVHHHLIVIARPAVLVLVYSAVWLALVILVDFFRNGWALLVGLALLLLLLAHLAWRTAVWTHANLVLTDRRLIYRTGVFTRHSREIPLPKINDVTFHQTTSGRIFGMGDLVIESSTESGKSTFFHLPRTDKLKLMILEQIHASSSGAEQRDAAYLAAEVARAVHEARPTTEIYPLPPERPPLYSEIVDQIERLEKMRERGTISEAEFRQAKEDLLSRLRKEPET